MNTKISKIKPMPLLRFTTAGSVDDGKSTLIGRLLVDSKGIYEDQLDAARIQQKNYGQNSEIDLASITDGLQAEREQGITIDVAYRYFSTPQRKFIIADTPGHEQYTRNMVTGASTADAAIILIDATKGVRTQSKRHAYLAHLLGIKHLIVAVNKMDVVKYQSSVYVDIREEFRQYCHNLGVRDTHFLPVSALQGDMIASRGDNLDWYNGRTLLQILENLQVSTDPNESVLRFPVQLVLRPNSKQAINYRSYLGRIESGSITVGDEILVLPSNRSTRVKEIITYEGSIQTARRNQSVTLVLEDEIDISRGDMIVGNLEQPSATKQLDAHICWMSEKSMQLGDSYLIKHTTNTVTSVVQKLHYSIDINTSDRISNTKALQLNEIGRVQIRLLQPLIADRYSEIKQTGGFIMIDSNTHNTVAAGMILQAS